MFQICEIVHAQVGLVKINTLTAKMFGAKTFRENIFGEQMFGWFFLKSPKISINNFGEKGFLKFPPKSSFSRYIETFVAIQFQCFRSCDTPFFSKMNVTKVTFP